MPRSLHGALHGALGALVALAFAAASAGAQTRQMDSAFVDLRNDGNGVGTLLNPITTGFSGLTADAAFKTIALAAQLNITYDPRLSGMQTVVSIPAHVRPAAVALIEVAEASKLRVRVSRAGEIVVVVAPAPIPHGTIARANPAEAVVLPTVRTDARRTERVAFDSRTEVGGISMMGRELRNTPMFVEPDLLRSIQAMPGVAVRSDYSAGFNVRGGENDQNLVLIDGYPIYNPSHLGGVFSTFIDPTVGKVDLRRGGLPVQYGGRLSGVLDVASAEPTNTGAHGVAEVSLVSSIASVGGAFADGSGSWMIAGRRTYADRLVNIFRPGAFPYHFRDEQAHLNRAFGNGVRLSVTVYDGEDESKQEANGNTSASLVNWGNGVRGITLAKRVDRPHLFGMRFGDSVVVEQRASSTRFNSLIDVPDLIYLASDYVIDRRLAGSITTFAPHVTRTIGYELSFQRLDYFVNAPFAGIQDFIPFDSVRQHSRSASVYADQTWRASPALLIEVGGRVDAVPTAKWTGFSPRVSMKYWINPNLAVTAGGGSYAQWMHSLGREEEPVQPMQFWVASDFVLPVSRARDAIVGVERWMTPSRLIHVEGFYKRYHDLLTPNPYSDPGVHGDEFQRAEGTSYGADLLIRQLEGGPFSGWLAYTYGVSTRARADGVHYFPTQDRRHNLNLVGSWHAGPYTLGARVNVASGLPHTPVIGSYIRARYDPTFRHWVPDPTSPDKQSIPGALNSERLPAYDRIDVSVTRVGHVHGAVVSPYVSVVNLLNAHNAAAYMYEYDFNSKRASFPNLPFVPTAGVTIAY